MNQMLRGINVYLIGMMGTGKTTIGRVLAQQLTYRFFDTDILVEQVAGKTIRAIFAQEGEDQFRGLESKVLAEVSACTKSVIATGGGIVLRPVNWGNLRHGLIIWLDTPVELIAQRLASCSTRPLLQEGDPLVKLSSLLEERRSLYAQADLRIVIAANQTPEQIVADILDRIPQVLKSTLPGATNEGETSPKIGMG